jgi:enoyl-CoA hydratase/carnithine racemase
MRNVMTDEITVSSTNGVQTLRINRPAKKNAITDAMYRALADGLTAGDADPSVRVHVILGSAGVFTAGNDIADFLSVSAGGGTDLQGLRFITLLPKVEKPIIAGVDGAAIGVGTTMLFHCDLVYATPSSTFATPFADLGLVPEAASSLLMPLRMGYARAFEMLALGAIFTAERMREAGLVNAIVAPDELEASVLQTARALVKKPPEAIAMTRRLMRLGSDAIGQRTEIEIAAFVERLSTPEARRAFESFLSKRG